LNLGHHIIMRYLTSISLAAGAVFGPLFVQADCTVGAIDLKNVTTLPDPFTFVNGTPVTSAADWDCRRQELNSLIQEYELGTMPGPPAFVEGTISGNESNILNVFVDDNGHSITFSPTITYPAGFGPFPAMIVFDGVSIPIPDGVAIITLDVDEIAAQVDTSSRGQGLFYDLYGADATASAMMAWAWAVSRIIDALESLQDDAFIKVERIGVTGCSRNGKGALVAGAFEPRIALTIPQESGSGGDACWRLSDAEQAAGNVVQTASEIVTENVWFALSFDQFSNDTDLLPFDHHSLAGLIAPRALLAIENTFYEWLSPWSSDGCMLAAHTIWEALGVPNNMGFTQDGNHSHCVFPDDQVDALEAYISKFLLDDDTTNTTVFTSPEIFPESQWITWEIPDLAPSPVSSVPPVSSPPVGVPEYGQCGGVGFDGLTVCQPGFVCIVHSAYFSQCLLVD